MAEEAEEKAEKATFILRMSGNTLSRAEYQVKNEENALCVVKLPAIEIERQRREDSTGPANLEMKTPDEIKIEIESAPKEEEESLKEDTELKSVEMKTEDEIKIKEEESAPEVEEQYLKEDAELKSSFVKLTDILIKKGPAESSSKSNKSKTQGIKHHCFFVKF